MSATHDTQAIRDALAMIIAPGQIVELRILSAGGRSNNTASGYFDDLDKAATAAARYNGSAAVYMTLHAVNPALLARAANRVQEYARTTTTDSDILARHWILIDVDSTRPAGISATDEEHEAALIRAQEVRDWLAGQGWPDPISADSGNGGHLLYAVDLPADDGGLTQRVLAGLAERFDDARVKIDRSVYNPARISKVYGTFACKGDHTAERPHRLASIIEAPEHLTAVPVTLLESLAATAPVNGNRPAGAVVSSGKRIAAGFDVEAYLREHGVGFTGPVGYNGGEKWMLDRCVWNGHTDHAAIVIRRADGSLGANCSHNSCEGKGWLDLREELEPGFRAAKEAREREFAAKNGNGAPLAGAAPHVDPATGEVLDDLPRIDAGNHDLPDVTRRAWDALVAANDPPYLFLHGSVPSRLELDPDGGIVLVPLTEHRLRHEVARSADWYVTKTKGGEAFTMSAEPPLSVVQNMLAQAVLPLPILRRVTQTPVFAPDGRLIEASGYDAASGIYYRPAAGLSVPPVPSVPAGEDIENARNLIVNDLLGDFLFTEQADRAAAVALNTLPYVRSMIAGLTPMNGIESPTVGSGKGLLSDVLVRPAFGQHSGMIAEARDDDEWRKRIGAKLREGSPIIHLDNLTRPLDSGALAMALTSGVFSDRILGQTATFRTRVDCIWVFTANNPVMSLEIARRTIRIRIDTNEEKPWQRTTFKHKNLRAWVDTHRAELVHAALVLVRAWIAAGKPMAAVTLGSYEEWAATMGGILNIAGVPGFLANLNDFYEAADLEGATWREFVALWAEKYGSNKVGTGELFPLASEVDGLDLGKGSERSQRTTFGAQLTKQRDRIYNGYRITLVGTSKRAKQWRLLAGKPGAGEPWQQRFTPDSPAIASKTHETVNLGEPFPIPAHGKICADISLVRPGEKVHLGSPNSGNTLAGQGKSGVNLSSRGSPPDRDTCCDIPPERDEAEVLWGWVAGVKAERIADVPEPVRQSAMRHGFTIDTFAPVQLEAERLGHHLDALQSTAPQAPNVKEKTDVHA